MSKSTDLVERRRRMVQNQVEARGVTDERVLGAMRKVPRERFVPEDVRDRAYTDGPLPIGAGQTISQPYIVALMAEALELGPDDRVLEAGTGSGYAASVLAELAAEVFTVERHEELADGARAILDELGYTNIHVKHGDGTTGWAEEAPFDAIVSAAAGPRVPDAFQTQLTEGGRLVMPVGDKSMHQSLVRVRRLEDGSFEREDLGAVRFVPLVGEQGFEH